MNIGPPPGSRRRTTRVLLAGAGVLLLLAAVLWATSPGLGRRRAMATYSLAGYWTGSGAPGGALRRPMGVAVGPDGSVYVTDGKQRVVRFSPQGALLGQWGRPGSGNGEFSNPVGIAVGPDGSVYVSDYDQDRVQRFTADGRFLLQFGRHGSGRGELDAPAGLAVDAAGRVYVADFYNSRIEEFSPDGRFLGASGVPGRMGVGALHYPTGVAALPTGGVLVADAYNYELQWFTESGKAVRRIGHRLFWLWPRPATGRSGLNVPTGVAVGPHGRIHVADSADHSVVLLSPRGRFATEWRIPHPVPGIFSPEQVAVSGNGGTVYATDFAGNRLIVLRVVSAAHAR